MQRRYHDLATAGIRAAETQIIELTVFAEQLRVSADHLSSEPVDGPCGMGPHINTDRDDWTTA